MQKKRYLAASVMGAAMLTACGDRTPSTADMSQLEDEGVLKVATRNAGTTYYLDRHQRPVGPEHDLVYAFARDNDWDIEWHVLDSTADVLQALDEGRVHLAAAGLTQTRARNERFARGPAHTEVRQQLVCHRELQPRPRRTADLVGLNIQVTANSSYADTLRKLQTQHDDLDRAIADGTDTGFVKVLTAAGSDRILGVTIVGEHAGDLIAEYVLAMKHGLGLNKILGTIHIYPTLAEANKFAAGEWKKAHAPQRVLAWLARYHRWQRG